ARGSAGRRRATPQRTQLVPGQTGGRAGFSFRRRTRRAVGRGGSGSTGDPGTRSGGDPMTAKQLQPAGPINWEEIRQRLALMAATDALRLSPEQVKAVLDDRARALAQVPPQAPDATRVLEVAKC